MAAGTIINAESPKTQTIEAVKGLLSWKGRSADPLPSFVELGKEESRLVLVLSNKKDAYYTTTARDCSCPARNWHPGQPCKHQRRYFPEAATKPAAAVMERKPFKPFIEDEVGQKSCTTKTVSYSPLIDTTPDATPAELAYWSIQHDREMWPAEA